MDQRARESFADAVHRVVTFVFATIWLIGILWILYAIAWGLVTTTPPPTVSVPGYVP